MGSKPWRSTTEHLQKLYDAGWDLGNHSWTHARMAELPDDLIEDEIRLTDEFLGQHGFERGRRHFAYPCSSYDGRVIAALKKYCDTGRAVTGRVGPAKVAGDALYKLDCVSMKRDDPVSRGTAAVDKAACTGGAAHVMFEVIEEDPKSVEAYSLAKFLDFVAHVRNVRDEGGVEVLTLSEFYARA